MITNKDLQRTHNLIRGMTIPSRPTVMLEVIKAQNAFAPNLQRIAEIISRDVVLASRILQEANTTLPGFKRKVGSIEQAVMLLGLSNLRRVVTNLFLNTSLISKDDPLQPMRNRCALMGRIVANLAVTLPQHAPPFRSGYLPLIAPDEAYALGLFHDCGLLILMQIFSDYQTFYTELQEDGSRLLVQAEDQRFRTNHCAVGYLLCESWQLPPELCAVIRDHHRLHDFAKPGKKGPERRAVTMHAILKLAEYLGGELSRTEWEQTRDDLFRFFGIGETEMASLRQSYQQAAASPPPLVSASEEG